MTIERKDIEVLLNETEIGIKRHRYIADRCSKDKNSQDQKYHDGIVYQLEKTRMEYLNLLRKLNNGKGLGNDRTHKI